MLRNFRKLCFINFLYVRETDLVLPLLSIPRQNTIADLLLFKRRIYLFWGTVKKHDFANCRSFYSIVILCIYTNYSQQITIAVVYHFFYLYMVPYLLIIMDILMMGTQQCYEL